nr:Chain B, Mothers against decapentaplegic homolog 1 [Homo sapiens]
TPPPAYLPPEDP